MSVGVVTNRAIHFIGTKDCPYTLRGRNLATMRRAKLRLIAKALGVSGEGSKNDILGRMIARLKASNSETELDPKWGQDEE